MIIVKPSHILRIWPIRRIISISITMDKMAVFVSVPLFSLGLIDWSSLSSWKPAQLKWLYTIWSHTIAPTLHKGFPSNMPWSLDAFWLTAVFIDPFSPTLSIPSPPLPASPTVFPHQWCGAGRLSGLRLEQLSAAQRTLLIGSPEAVPLVEQSRAVTVEACRREPEPMQP